MANKRPYAHVKSTAATIDLIIDRVMLYLREANCFGEDGEIDAEVHEFYRKEVRAAVTTVLSDQSILFSLDVGDVNDKLDLLVYGWDRDTWPAARKIKVLEATYRSEGIAQALDFCLQQEVEKELE